MQDELNYDSYICENADGTYTVDYGNLYITCATMFRAKELVRTERERLNNPTQPERFLYWE